MGNCKVAGIYVRSAVVNEAAVSKQEIDGRQFISESRDLITGSTYVDNGHSGFNLDREGLGQMLTDAAQRKFEVLIVSDADRLCRDTDGFLFLDTLIKGFGAQIIVAPVSSSHR